MDRPTREPARTVASFLVTVAAAWLILAGILVIFGPARPSTTRGWMFVSLLAPLALVPYALAEVTGAWVLSFGRARALARRSKSLRVLLASLAGVCYLALMLVVFAALHWSWQRMGIR